MKYLWIDSLCIVQDSQEDWHRESSLINKVYRHSFCNIAAAASVDSHSGCFFPREPDSMPALLAPYEVLCRWKGGNVVPYLLTIENMWELEVEQSPLHREGWVLQEYLLSP
jgi:Heterokaryon incompatibility protein (HET)